MLGFSVEGANQECEELLIAVGMKYLIQSSNQGFEDIVGDVARFLAGKRSVAIKAIFSESHLGFSR